MCCAGIAIVWYAGGVETIAGFSGSDEERKEFGTEKMYQMYGA